MKNLTKTKTFKNNISQNIKLSSNTAFFKGIIVVLLISLVSFLTSCKKDYGEVTTRVLNVAEFSSITNSGDANITIEYGTTQMLEATGNIRILDRIKANVSAYNLDLDLKDGIYHDYELSYKITMPYIEQVKIKGSGNINIDNFNQTENLTLDISGNGGITFFAFPNIDKIDIDISGSGTITGQSAIDSIQNLNIDISGSGMYSAYMVKAKNCAIDISGSGNASVYVIDNLDVDIAGSGNVNYKGYPNIASDITGSGSISNKN